MNISPNLAFGRRKKMGVQKVYQGAFSFCRAPEKFSRGGGGEAPDGNVTPLGGLPSLIKETRFRDIHIDGRWICILEHSPPSWWLFEVTHPSALVRRLVCPVLPISQKTPQKTKF